MSIDMANNVQDAMTVDPLDDALFSFMDNATASQYFPLDVPEPNLEMWATAYNNDQAYTTQSQPFLFGCHEEVSNDDSINFTPVLAPPAQWWYPEDGGARWDGVYRDSESFPADGDPTPSAKSCSTGPSHVWHGMNPMCDMTYTGMEGAMYMDGSPGEHQLNVTVTGPSAETSWGDNEVFEPYIASYQSASAQYPDAACMLGFPEYIGGSSLNTVVQGHSDEISLASGNVQQPSDSLANPVESEEGEANEDKPARQRKVAEEDLYCRVGFCLESFKDPHMCAKHRQTHFDPSWHCPGPCRTKTKKGGWFARKETLKRHLDTPAFTDCKEAALKLKAISEAIHPESGTGWMDQFCERPERPWECAGFEFTDLETVKGWQRDPNFRAPPAKRIQGRHRSK